MSLGQFYKIMDRQANDALLFIETPYGSQIWTLTKRAVTKNHRCLKCGNDIVGKADRAYRPITNQKNRMRRICLKCGKEKD